MAKRGASPGGPSDPHNRPPPPKPGREPAAAGPAAPRPDSPGELLVQTFDRLRDELVSTLAYVLGNRDDAQDAAQEAFLKCWRARDSLPDVQNVRAWVFRVGLNTARDYQRSGWNKRAKPLIAEDVLLPARDVPPADRMEEEENIARLRRAILDLRPEEREVFLLRQDGELTYEQIADLRDTPVGTVKTQMRTALIKLRKVLNPGANPPPDE
jgi:RNA polymerase sigma-70 factor, ECF subfamily